MRQILLTGIAVLAVGFFGVDLLMQIWGLLTGPALPRLLSVPSSGNFGALLPTLMFGALDVFVLATVGPFVLRRVQLFKEAWALGRTEQVPGTGAENDVDLPGEGSEKSRTGGHGRRRSVWSKGAAALMLAGPTALLGDANSWSGWAESLIPATIVVVVFVAAYELLLAVLKRILPPRLTAVEGEFPRVRTGSVTGDRRRFRGFPFRKLVMGASGIALVAMVMFPPWVRTYQEAGESRVQTSAGYHFVGAPPSVSTSELRRGFGVGLDTGRLGLQVVALLAFVGVILVVTSPRKPTPSSG